MRIDTPSDPITAGKTPIQERLKPNPSFTSTLEQNPNETSCCCQLYQTIISYLTLFIDWVKSLFSSNSEQQSLPAEKPQVQTKRKITPLVVRNIGKKTDGKAKYEFPK